MYLLATLGMDMIASMWVESHGGQLFLARSEGDLGWNFLTIVEEALEMLGCILVMHGLLLSIGCRPVRVSFSTSLRDRPLSGESISRPPRPRLRSWGRRRSA